MIETESITEICRESCYPLTGDENDFDPLLELIGDARLVLLGEATHGTREFYEMRAAITRRLIEEKGFNALAIEADWPDAYRVHRYVIGESDDGDAGEALRGFLRFPQWMWRNRQFRDFIEWLRDHNRRRFPGEAVGLYGLDLYSLFASIEAVVRYLEGVDPEAAARARERYACFEHAAGEAQLYGQMVDLGVTPDCEEEALRQLLELQHDAERLIRKGGEVSADEHFFAEQNARLVMNAEAYYRTMFRGRTPSWNLRDRHMADTLDALIEHLDRQGRDPAIVVWEHNSHLGDARATYMHEIGELNVGQLVRERHGDYVRLVGFTTYSGTVTATHDWDGPAERKRVRPALHGSYERLFHDVGIPGFMLDFREKGELAEVLREPRLERAIGVVYRPLSERHSHYFDAHMSEQFDAVIHIDETHAVEPLDRTPLWDSGEPPETYPFGI